MAFFASKRKVRPRDDAESEELNVVPYLDILMNLIIFVLLSMTGLATFGSLNVTASGHGAAGAPPEALLLTVAVSETGHHLSTSAGDGPLVPKRADGLYDFDALNAALTRLKAQYPTESKIILTADKGVAYDVLVGTMDAARESTGHQPLFRDVTLAGL